MNCGMSSDRLGDVADLAVARKRQREAAAEQADASHHELALAWRDARAVDGAEPVYSAGALYVGAADGLWHARTAERVQVEVAQMFAGRKLCRRQSDYRQIVEHIAALCEDEGFFEDASAGVTSPAGFHRIGQGGAIETVKLELRHRQAFALAVAPDYDAEAPLLQRVLDEAFEGADAAAQIDLWWQAFGAALFGLMPRLQTVLLLLGRERSGKSLLQRVLEQAFPAEAVGAVSPASWNHEYHVAALAGKRLNLVGELADNAPIPAAAFKNVTGQNLVAGRHPTHRPFSFRCGAAHFFASNVLPPTTDRSEAFYRRWRILGFENTVPAERVDSTLFEKIVAAELPAIVAEAFLGAERVARAGALRVTATHEAALQRWRLAANPVQQFLADADWIALDHDADAHGKPEVYEAYRRWSAEAGFRNPFGRNHFLELLNATGATRGVRIRRVGSRDVVVGLRLVDRTLTTR